MIRIGYRPALFTALGFVCILCIWIYGPVLLRKLNNVPVDNLDSTKLNVTKPSFSNQGEAHPLTGTKS